MEQRFLASKLVEKERKKMEKLKMFQEKQKTKQPASAASKTKEKKAKAEFRDEPLPECVEKAPPGEKRKSAYKPLTSF